MYLDSESKTRLTSLNADRPFAESVRRKTERTNKMKKLIAIAAVALAGLTFAAECSTCNTCNTCNTCGTPCGWGYRIKVLLKTTATNTQIKQVNTCGTCGTCATCKEACYRKPTTKRFLGYVFGHTGKTTCSTCTCNAWDRFNLVLWNYDTKAPVAVRRLDVLQFNRFGQSEGSMAEVAVRLSNQGIEPFDLQFAGFGEMGTRTDGTPAIKSISGFCAGIIPALCKDNLKDQCGNPIPGQAYRSRIWTICREPLYSATTAAYGKWVMAWDSAIVNRINNGAIKFWTPTEGDDPDERDGFEASAGYTPARFTRGAALFFGAIDKEIDTEADVPCYTATCKAWLNHFEELGESSGDDVEEGLFWACDQTLVEVAPEEDPS